LGGAKEWDGYRAYSYLEAGFDFRVFNLTKGVGRVPEYRIPLSRIDEERFERLIEANTIVDLHEHPVLYPENMTQLSEVNGLGRQFTAYEDLAKAGVDCVFDHMMDGMSYITSFSGWKWNDVVHDIGIRLCDLAHQRTVTHCRGVGDINEAHGDGKIALVLCLESATPIENEVDRVDVLYGLGVRSMGICYSESNMLGGGMGETRLDSGLTDFGYDAVRRMNKVGMLVDVGHTNDQTALETIEASKDPIYNSHSGPGAIAQGHTNGDEFLHALAESDGLLGIGGAGRGLRTRKHPIGSIDSYGECLSYCIDVMGVNHVGCGPDSLYGDHQALYSVWLPRRMGHYKRPGASEVGEFPVPKGEVDPGYVRGLENPSEFTNIARWMVANGFSDGEIGKVMGGNAFRLLERVWD
jgi:membrane dipeptidase